MTYLRKHKHLIKNDHLPCFEFEPRLVQSFNLKLGITTSQQQQN